MSVSSDEISRCVLHGSVHKLLHVPRVMQHMLNGTYVFDKHLCGVDR